MTSKYDKELQKEREQNFNTFISTNCIKNSTKTNLIRAMRYAIDVIESYQLDARTIQSVVPGYCQGYLYEHVKPFISGVLFGVKDPEESHPEIYEKRPKSIAEKFFDWSSLAPRYRTKARLISMLTDTPYFTERQKAILSRNPIIPGVNTVQFTKFLESCKSGDSIEFHNADYVILSRKRYNEITLAAQNPIKIIVGEFKGGKMSKLKPLLRRRKLSVCPAHSDGHHYFVGENSCICGAKPNVTGPHGPDVPRAPGPEVGV